MDNLAHSLVGLAASKAGLEKLSPGATTVCVLAANAPDLDFVMGLGGDRWTLLHYHRGITHSLVGVIFLALIIPSIFTLVDLSISRLRARPRRFNFGGLFLAALIAGATHPILDWTNNYGVRPLLPWNNKWFSGDLVFVVDPVLWLIFGGAAFLLTSQSRRRVVLWAVLAAALTGLVVYAATISSGLEHPQTVLLLWITLLVILGAGYRAGVGPILGRRLAGGAFILFIIYLGMLSLLHQKAMNRAGERALTLATRNHEQVVKLAAMPTLANPDHWRCVAETDRAVYRFELYLAGPGQGITDLVRYSKPDPADAGIHSRAVQDRRAQAFFEFARFPVERFIGDCATGTLVQFADLRYTEPGKPRGSFAIELPVECPPQAQETTNGRK
jgi:inner membrane protein